MREIKFKAWEPSRNKMWPMAFVGMEEIICAERLENGKSLVHSNKKEFFIPLQFTGLKDKSGKEIYEGDRILLINKNSPNYTVNQIWEVKWDYNGYECFWCDGSEDFEVIGNIYENMNKVDVAVKEEKLFKLSNCDNCNEEAWDGYICHNCGAKNI